MLTLTPEGIRFDRERCCQCGVCLSSCPVDALSSAPPDAEGLYPIVCDAGRCIRCGRCAQVCPAHELPNDTVAEEQIRAAPGRYLAFAADPEVRWMASSGGVARALVAQVLHTGTVDAVYTLTYPEDPNPPASPAHGRRRVVPTGQEVAGGWWTVPPSQERVPTSIYRPVLWGRDLGTLAPAWKRVLLVGLPCQIKGAKQLLSMLRPGLDVVSVVLLCRQQKTGLYTRRLKKLMGVSASSAAPWMTYRGEGWPGVVRDHGVRQEIPFISTGFAFGSGIGIWTLPGCDYCASPCGAYAADVCIADPWTLVSPGMDPQGSSVVYAWTDAGRNLLESAQPQVSLHALPADDAVRVMDLPRIRRKGGSIAVRMGRQPATQDFCAQERLRKKQERLFWKIHPEHWLWKSYSSFAWRVKSAIRSLLGPLKKWLRSPGAKS